MKKRKNLVDSNVEWMGSIPKDWDLCFLRKVVQYQNGYAFGDDELSSEETDNILIKISEVTEKGVILKDRTQWIVNHFDNKKVLLKDRDVLVSLSGATAMKNCVFYPPLDNKKFFLNQRVAILRNQQDFFQKYLFYFINSAGFKKHVLLLASMGAAQENISKDHLLKTPICYPKKATDMISIVSFLDNKTSLIDKKISLLEKKIELYEEFKKRSIQKEFEKLISQKMIKLKAVISKTIGGDWGDDAEENTPGSVIVLRVNNFDDGKIDYNDVTYRLIKKSSIKSRTLNPGELLIEKSGGGEKTPVGRVCIFDSSLSNVLFSNFIAKIILKPLVEPRYVLYFFKSLYDSRQILKYIKQNTGIQNLELPALLNETIPIIDTKDQQVIVKKLDLKIAKIDKLIELTKKEIELQKEYKKTLINDVVTGKIEV